MGIFLVTLIIDPNQFKPNIESTASNAGVELGIDGDLAWQFLPLGISVEKVNFVCQRYWDCHWMCIGDILCSFVPIIDKIFTTNLAVCKCQIGGEDFVNFFYLLRKKKL